MITTQKTRCHPEQSEGSGFLNVVSPSRRQTPRSLAPLGMTTKTLPPGGWDFCLLRRGAGHGCDSRALRPALGCGCGSCWSCCWRQSQLLAHLGFELDHRVFVFFQEGARVFASLADAFAFVAVPRARLLHDVMNRSDVEQIAFARNSFPVHDVEFGFTERCRHFVFHYFDFGA